MAETFSIHLVLPAEDGPIVTKAAGDPVKITPGGRYVVLCDPKLIPDGNKHRATDCPWGVRCSKCIAHPRWAELYRPKPGMSNADESEAVSPDPKKPCGGCK